MPAEKNVAEWRLVPTQPTPEMDAEGESVREFGASAVYAAMVEIAPQPPALGGEMLEALSHDLVIETERAIRQRDTFLKTGISTAGQGGSHDTCFPAILRKHVAPLLAEIERRDGKLETMRRKNNELNDDVAALIAERDTLKARCEELEAAAKVVVNNFMDDVVVHPCDENNDDVKSAALPYDIRHLRDALVQAAPAANAWPCWSCKNPVSMSERAEADGDCPHCNSELDLEMWPLPDGAPAAKDGAQ